MAKKYEIVTVPKNEIVVYQPNELVRLEVRVQDESVWLTQAQMCELFQRDVSVVSRHIKNVFSEGEVDKESNLHFLQIPNSDRPIAVYSLNVIISVGYRVKSQRGTQFRIWAMKILKDYTVHGLAVNRSRDALAAEMDRRLANHEQRLAADVVKPVDAIVSIASGWRDLSSPDAFETNASTWSVGFAPSSYGKNAAKRDVQLAFSRYQQQYPNDGLTLTQWSNAHDRFIFCDNTVWICRSSIKDAGRRMFALVKTGLRPDVVLTALPQQ